MFKVFKFIHYFWNSIEPLKENNQNDEKSKFGDETLTDRYVCNICLLFRVLVNLNFLNSNLFQSLSHKKKNIRKKKNMLSSLPYFIHANNKQFHFSFELHKNNKIQNLITKVYRVDRFK
jgi:hypothetical protein